MKHVLQPYQSRNLNLTNRVIMAPMTRSRANNSENRPIEGLHDVYYAQRASAGLLITEGSQVSKEAVGYINTAGIYTQSQIEGWKKVVEKVHAEGGKIFIQLWHVGRISHPDFHNGNLPLAPSALNPNADVYTPDGPKKTVTPKAMSQEDIDRTISDFQHAAKNAIEAGFDGVEIHSSNGYLFHQFFNATSNKRSDNYGESIENRTRFFFEVLDAMKKEISVSKIGVRLNPSLHGMFGMEMDEQTIPTFEHILDRLNDYDLAYVHLSEPFTDVSNVPHAVQHIAKHFRPIYKGTLMINAGFNQEKGNKVIKEGHADLVSFAKLYVSNPDLVKRFEKDSELTEWDSDTFYTTGKKGYTDYPKLNEMQKT